MSGVCGITERIGLKQTGVYSIKIPTGYIALADVVVVQQRAGRSSFFFFFSLFLFGRLERGIELAGPIN